MGDTGAVIVTGASETHQRACSDGHLLSENVHKKVNSTPVKLHNKLRSADIGINSHMSFKTQVTPTHLEVSLAVPFSTALVATRVFAFL